MACRAGSRGFLGLLPSGSPVPWAIVRRLQPDRPHETPYLPPPEPPVTRRLYVGNLPREVNEALLHFAFSENGRSVKNVEIVLNAATGSPQGHAYLEMGSEEDREAAIAALHGSDLDGRVLEVHAADCDGG